MGLVAESKLTVKLSFSLKFNYFNFINTVKKETRKVEKIKTWKRGMIIEVESHCSRNYQTEDKISPAEKSPHSPDRIGSSL